MTNLQSISSNTDKLINRTEPINQWKNNYDCSCAGCYCPCCRHYCGRCCGWDCCCGGFTITDSTAPQDKIGDKEVVKELTEFLGREWEWSSSIAGAKIWFVPCLAWSPGGLVMGVMVCVATICSVVYSGDDRIIRVFQPQGATLPSR